ncbi:hypothetical protein MKX03_024562 [Papaver bracteatum]|nr:hypothetical protein MKX03_024562 [Papaver bracteatum]
MTLKIHSPLPENPPSASSSSDSEDEREVEEEVVNNKEEESDDSEEEEEEEESGDDDEETEKSKFCVVPNPKPKSKDAEEEEEDSDDDSESDEQIPIQKVEEVKKPEQTSIPPAKRPVAKGQVEAEKSSKRRKKNNDGNAGEEPEKKTARVWTEEGEIVLLKGMIDYMKQGKNPNSDSNGFYEFIKGSINVDVSKEQLSSKIRHAKGRYRQNEAKEKNGEVLTFTKSHFKKCYELSKSIWGAEINQENDGKEKKGSEATEVNGATNGKNKSKKKKASNDAGVSEKREESVKVVDVGGKLKATVEKQEVEGCGLIELAQHMAPPGLKSFLNKRAFQLLEPLKREAFEKRWKDLQVAEGELFLRRIDLVREYSSKALEALKSRTS